MSRIDDPLKFDYAPSLVWYFIEHKYANNKKFYHFLFLSFQNVATQRDKAKEPSRKEEKRKRKEHKIPYQSNAAFRID